MASPSGATRAALERPPESALARRGDAAGEGPPVGDRSVFSRAETLEWLDRRLAGLCRERGPLRAVLARLAFRLVNLRAWERIGYARLGDYAVERLSLSGRSVRDLAEVGARLGALPHLEHALVSGTLGWTKVRLLARLPRDADEVAWVAYASRVTADALGRTVRAVDRGSVEGGGTEEPAARSRLFEVRCTPEVRWKWEVARGTAARAAGRVLHVSEAAELIAAEILSALPIDERARGTCEESGASWDRESETERQKESEAEEERARSDGRGRPDPHAPGAAVGGAVPFPHRMGAAPGDGADTAPTAPRPPWRHDGADTAPHTSKGPHPGVSSAPESRPPLPSSLRSLLDGLEDADAFEVDDRLRHALQMEQRLEARVGPLLTLAWRRFLHTALGHATRDAYARERLGMDPTRARALVRLERTAVLSEPFARAYRVGALSWVKASVLAPLVSANPLGWFVRDWVIWAQRVTVRRLREDVDAALALAETNPEAFRGDGGLPSDARGDREIGAQRMGPVEDLTQADPGAGENPQAGDGRRMGAPATPPQKEVGGGVGAGDHTLPSVGSGERPRATSDRGIRAPRKALEENCFARFLGPPDVVQLFRAVLCTVRRRMDAEEGRLPTAGAALGVMLDHVLSTWGNRDGTLAARHKVFARDGWRCAAPGCTSMRNLHDHHIRFRSAGGSNAAENRVTLCAFHHLRGVHAGLLRCVGRAPNGLRWEMGIRPGVTPLLAYRSGDVRVSRASRTTGAPRVPGVAATAH